jgi:hypothetical protein
MFLKKDTLTFTNFVSVWMVPKHKERFWSISFVIFAKLLVGLVDDYIQMTTTLICLDLQLVHHFIEGTDIDTTDINTTTILVLLVLVLSNCSTTLCYCLAFGVVVGVRLAADGQSTSSSWYRASLCGS